MSTPTVHYRDLSVPAGLPMTALCGLHGNIALAYVWDQVTCADCLALRGSECDQEYIAPIWERHPWGCLAAFIGTILAVTVVLALLFATG